MFLLFIPAIIFAVAFIISFIIEKRRFRNGIYLLMAVILVYYPMCFYLGNQGIGAVVALVLPAILIPLASVIFSGVFIWAGVMTMKREGLRPKNALALMFGIGIWLFYALCVYVIVGAYKHELVLYVTILLVMLCCFYIFAFVSFFFYSLLYTKMPKRIKCDYIIIHGAGLLGGERVSPLLAKRIDKAIAIWEKGGRKATLIPSGGKGGDEKVTEADAITGYLDERGVPKEKILKEDRSTTTFENIRNSKTVMDEHWRGDKGYRCIFVTNDYHVFRTSTYARKVKLKADGVGCKTALYYWPGAFIREYVALMVTYKWTVVPVILIWALLAWVSYMPD